MSVKIQQLSPADVASAARELSLDPAMVVDQRDNLTEALEIKLGPDKSRAALSKLCAYHQSAFSPVPEPPRSCLSENRSGGIMAERLAAHDPLAKFLSAESIAKLGIDLRPGVGFVSAEDIKSLFFSSVIQDDPDKFVQAILDSEKVALNTDAAGASEFIRQFAAAGGSQSIGRKLAQKLAGDNEDLLAQLELTFLLGKELRSLRYVSDQALEIVRGMKE